jgi:hypothetical protein
VMVATWIVNIFLREAALATGPWPQHSAHSRAALPYQRTIECSHAAVSLKKWRNCGLFAIASKMPPP